MVAFSAAGLSINREFPLPSFLPQHSTRLSSAHRYVITSEHTFLSHCSKIASVVGDKNAGYLLSTSLTAILRVIFGGDDNNDGFHTDPYFPRS